MTFTKKKLAAAMTGTLLASGGIQTTQAASVDFDAVGVAAATGTLNYASELAIPATGINLAHANLSMDISGVNNVLQIAANTEVRTTLTLSSGTFANPPTMSLLTGPALANVSACINIANTSLACPAVSRFSGGTTADSTVTFQTATTTQRIGANAHFNIRTNGIKVTDQSAITATVGVVIADNFGPTTLASNSGSYLRFSPLLALASDLAGSTAKNIDVTQNSLFFSPTAGGTGTGGRTYNVGGAIITEGGTTTNGAVGTAPVGAATVAIQADDVLSTVQHTITAANGFSAFNQGTAVGVAGSSIAVGAATATVSTADSTLAVAATATVEPGGSTVGANDVTLSLPAALTPNTVLIAETTLTDTVTTVAKTGYTATSSTGTIALRSLVRNGSSARLTFAVNPTSAYPMSIRITNPSAIVGTATLQLINDDGDVSASIPITAIAGGPTADLAANSSTGLLAMADVFAAVQAADATFSLGTTSNKLRVAVSASLPAVILNAFTLSSDGTTFSMVTDAGA